MATELGFEILGEIRTPPRRARTEGKYASVHAALEDAKGADGEWVALASGTKAQMQGVRNAISKPVQDDLAWHTGMHAEEDDPDVFVLYVKYDEAKKRNRRAPSKRKAKVPTEPVPEVDPVAEEPAVAAEDGDDQWFGDEPAAE